MTISFEFTDEEIAGIISLASIGCVYMSRKYFDSDGPDGNNEAQLELDNIEKDSENRVLHLILAEKYSTVLDKLDSIGRLWVESISDQRDEPAMPSDEDKEV